MPSAPPACRRVATVVGFCVTFGGFAAGIALLPIAFTDTKRLQRCCAAIGEAKRRHHNYARHNTRNGFDGANGTPLPEQFSEDLERAAWS